ncbi:hypothetical protein [Caldimonas taiwanensis]|uniref:hypothetical protein n=1 Tax=Caldimonas taiwanensis TaxID=307483 RepID=UPI0018DC21CB
MHHSPDRAIVAHLDTRGAMVKQLKPNGRLELVPMGDGSSRFAEGARVTPYGDDGLMCRGTILPCKASSHTSTMRSTVSRCPGRTWMCCSETWPS